MYPLLIKRLPLTQPGFLQVFLLFVRVLHGFTAIVPGFLFISLDTYPNEGHGDFLALLLFFAFLSVLVFNLFGVYNSSLFSNLLRFRLMLFSWGGAFCFLIYMHRELGLLEHLTNWHLALWFFSSYLLYCAERLLLLNVFKRLMHDGLFLSNAVILGATETGQRLAEHLQQRGDIRLGLKGFIDDRATRITHELSGMPVLGTVADLEQMIRKDQVQQVLVALPWSAESRIGALIGKLRQLPVKVLLVPDRLAFYHSRNRVSNVSNIPMFNASELPLHGWSPLMKRFEDLLIGSLMLLAAAPIMAIIALTIKLESDGPVFFLQKRYGYNNKLIRVFKFRSMYHAERDANASQQTTHNDPRVTKVGAFIRKTSLDELPQLFNVLNGTMSLVGPRPHATATKAAGVLFNDAVEEYNARHRVKPGITGWAQINGYRGETDTLEKIEKRVELDLEYIERWSVWFDLYILFRTLPAVALSKEVY